MPKHRLDTGTPVFPLIVLGGLLAIGYVGCVEPSEGPEDVEPEVEESARVSISCLDASQRPDPANPDLDCPAPPNTFDVSSFFASNADSAARALAGPTFDAWAWASFAALNWPVRRDSTQPSGFVRGVPDLSASFRAARNYDPVVWETFKEKREVFNTTITRSDSTGWQRITFDPAQQPRDGDTTGIPACPTSTVQQADRLATLRPLSGGSKLSPSISGDQTLDETVEVASPAQEPAVVLCAGYSSSTTPSAAFCSQTLFPDALLTDTTNGRTPVGPRVWKGDPGDTTKRARPVLFEVKVNYDFWDYIVSRGFYDTTTADAAARSPSESAHPKLPFRTSAATGPGNSPNAVFSYQAETVAGDYEDLADPDALPAVGSIHLKAAWLLLDSLVEDTTKFHTTSAIYYRSVGPGRDSLCYEVGRFGLIGLHIIQRVHAPSRTPQPDANFAVGGAFIFATWEHVSLGGYEQRSEYFYANYLARDTLINTRAPAPFDIQRQAFPNVSGGAGGINVVRQQRYPLASTQRVNAAVHAALDSGSVWRNYRLIGTQFLPVSSEAASLVYNQPYYLANLVVETNTGLQNFRGLPPGVTPTAYYTQTKNVPLRTSPNMYAFTYPNMVFNRQTRGRGPMNMGGCMGCHGVAQLNGYNFSFVFLAGLRGSGLDTQIHFEVAP